MLISIFLFNKIRIKKLIMVFSLFGGYLILNMVLCLTENLNVFNWAKFTLPIIAWPSAAIVTNYITINKEQALNLYKMIMVIMLLPLFIFSIIYFTNSFDYLVPEEMINIRNITIWREGIGHFGLLIFLLSLPYINRKWGFINFVAGTFSIMISFIRSIWVSILITLFSVLLLLIFSNYRKSCDSNRRNLLRNIIFGMIILLLMVIIVYILLPEFGRAIGERGKTLISINRILMERSYRYRLQESVAILREMGSKPFNLILGSGASSKFYFPEQVTYGGIYYFSDYSHNFYLYLLWNYGIVGMLLFIIGIIVLLANSYTLTRSEDYIIRTMSFGIFVTVICTAIVANISSFYNSPRWYVLFGILTGLICSFEDIVNSNLNNAVKKPENISYN